MHGERFIFKCHLEYERMFFNQLLTINRNCINQSLFPCPLIGAEISDPRNLAESRVSLHLFLKFNMGATYT